MLTALLVATSLQAQTPASSTPPPAAEATSERAAAAAERAAAAAEKAAEASSRMAAAVERLTEALGKTPAAEAATAPAAAPAEKKDEAPKEDPWKGSIGLGLISLSGNASTLTFNGLASAERKTKGWIYALKAQGLYGRSTLPATETEAERNQVVALGANVDLRVDRRFTPAISGYVLVGALTDHVKSVEVRGTGEAGAGISWWDEKTPAGGSTSLRTDLAFRFSRETRFQYYPTRLDVPDVDLGGPRVGVAFSYGLSKDTVFTEEAEAIPNVLGESRLLVNSISKLTVGLSDSLAVGTSFVLQYDSSPPPGKVSTDTALAANVQVSF
jgi:putative salt-induced outer membrane protein YdiY